MKLFNAISLLLTSLLLYSVMLNVYAGSIHKWVDAQGVTHYSDQLPEFSSEKNNNSVKQIEVLSAYSNSVKQSDISKNYHDDYYSVTNQWARMREERIARKQLQIEKAKSKAAQQPVVPQVVYVNQAEEERSRKYYPVYGFGHRGYGHKIHKKYNNYAGRYNGQTCRLPRSNYSRSYARSSRSSGLTLSIR